MNPLRKCLTILGARPQFIKAPLVSKELKEQGWDEIIVHTGQHYDYNMSGLFFEELALPTPHYNLGISGGTHSEMVSKMLLSISSLIDQHRPDCVIVYGDTNSTLAGALAAAQSKTPLAHIEAGLRSYRKEMPEEQNRKLTDHLADYLFCPTRRAVDNLKHEGITEGVYFSGDLMFDMSQIIEEDRSILDNLSLRKEEFHLLTIHRAEICQDIPFLREVLTWITSRHRHQHIIWPIHPRMKAMLSSSALQDLDISAIKVIEPVGYRQMMALVKHAKSVFTDSGGVQREAYFHETSCLTLRNETEWPETIEAGWNLLWDKRDHQLDFTTSANHYFSNGQNVAETIVNAIN
jgi:UDP-GlcNAc3NAcA epimerase